MQNKVKDTQRVFRNILDSLSRPGKIVELETTFDYQTSLSDETMDILMTLLDGEVTFHLVGEEPTAIEEIKIRTLATFVPLVEADYIILPDGTNQDYLINVFQQAKKGTLMDPNRSATVIIETENLTTSEKYTLSGPGVNGSREVFIATAEFWIEARNEAVSEFPLGIDCFIVDQTGQCMGLPRTTKMREVR